MRSLWRSLALRWLGGDASQSLSGEASLLDTLLFDAGAPEAEVYRVTREPAVSHDALTRRENAAETLVLGHDLRKD